MRDPRSVFKLSLCVLLGFVLGLMLSKSDVNLNQVTKIQAANENYHFIAPLLALEVVNPNPSPKLVTLEANIKKIIEKYQKEGVDQASVYLKGLNKGNTIAINETALYNPASLFKVPIMIAYLKEAEGNPDLLKEKIKFIKKELISSPQNIPPKKQAIFGNEYTIEELINYMIVYSDNNAANLLADRIYPNERNPYSQLFGDLDLPVSAEQVSAKSYSLFFRILYNATYLNREMSEKALSILSQSNFDDGLAAGLPKGVTIANKFGEYGTYVKGKYVQELHDCGIIYAPGKPYLLCVMTRGQSVQPEENFIQEVSKAVYEVATK